MKESNSMIDMFKGYFDYSESEYKNIWKDSLIIVDTNVLLNFYRCTEETRENLFNILNKLKGRLWIPYQVGKEFIENKNSVMISAYKDYDKIKLALNKKIGEAKECLNIKKNNQLKCKSQINDILEESKNKIEKLLDKEKTNQKPRFEKNDIEKKILELFNNSIGQEVDETKYNEMKIEGLRRIKEEIPPGYKDNQKEENGDYYIFCEIMEEAKKQKKDVIFVTDDVKEDWFNTFDGEKHGGRSELLSEFYMNTNQLLIIYTSDSFLEAYNKNLNSEKANEQTISELKTIRKTGIKDNLELEKIINYFDNKDSLLNEIYPSNENELKNKKLLEVAEKIIDNSNLSKKSRIKLFNELASIKYNDCRNAQLENEKIKKLIDNTHYLIQNENDTIHDEKKLRMFNSIYKRYSLMLEESKNPEEKIDICGILIDVIRDNLNYFRHSNASFRFITYKKLNELQNYLSDVIDNNILYDEKYIINELNEIVDS